MKKNSNVSASGTNANAASSHDYKTISKAVEHCVHKNREKGGKFVVVMVGKQYRLHNVTFDGFPEAPIVWARGAEGALEQAAMRRIADLMDGAL